MPASRDLERDLLQVEVEVRWPGDLRCQAAQGAGGREPSIKAAAGGLAARQRGAQGPARKKRLKPAARREAVIKVMERHGLSQRRACELVGLDRSTLRYSADDRTTRQSGND